METNVWLTNRVNKVTWPPLGVLTFRTRISLIKVAKLYYKTKFSL